MLLCWSDLVFCRFPVVAMGVLKWVDWTVSEPRYFQLQTDHTPVHLALLDEVKVCIRSYWRAKTVLMLVNWSYIPFTECLSFVVSINIQGGICFCWELIVWFCQLSIIYTRKT